MSERRSAPMRALILALAGMLVLAVALSGSIWFLGRDSQARTAAGIYAEKVAAAHSLAAEKAAAEAAVEMFRTAPKVDYERFRADLDAVVIIRLVRKLSYGYFALR